MQLRHEIKKKGKEKKKHSWERMDSQLEIQAGNTTTYKSTLKLKSIRKYRQLQTHNTLLLFYSPKWWGQSGHQSDLWFAGILHFDWPGDFYLRYILFWALSEHSEQSHSSQNNNDTGKWLGRRETNCWRILSRPGMDLNCDYSEKQPLKVVLRHLCLCWGICAKCSCVAQW